MMTSIASSVARAHHLGGANAGIHADDQLHACARGRLHHFGPHAVAVPQPVRHVKICDAAGQFDGLVQDDDGGGAVHVVIAVDQDLFAVADGARKRARPRRPCRAGRADRAGRRARGAESWRAAAGSPNPRPQAHGGGHADAAAPRPAPPTSLRVRFGEQPAGWLGMPVSCSRSTRPASRRRRRSSRRQVHGDFFADAQELLVPVGPHFVDVHARRDDRRPVRASR